MLTTNMLTLGSTVGGFQILDTVVVLVSFSILMLSLIHISEPTRPY